MLLPVPRDQGQLQTSAPMPWESPSGSVYWFHNWSNNSFPSLNIPLVLSGAHIRTCFTLGFFAPQYLLAAMTARKTEEPGRSSLHMHLVCIKLTALGEAR